MKALLEKQQAEQQFRQMMQEAGAKPDRTVEERVDHCKYLQYEEHQQLFAVGYSSFHKAAADNSLAGIKYFLGLRGHKKINPNALDHHGLTALHHAAANGHVDSIQYLIETAGMKINVRSSYGNTPLMIAVKENRVQAIALLCQLNADITLENNCGYTCFHFAAEANRFESIKAIGDIYIPWANPPKPKKNKAPKDSVEADNDSHNTEYEDNDNSEDEDNDSDGEDSDESESDDEAGANNKERLMKRRSATADGNLALFQLDLESSKKIAAAEIVQPTTIFSSRGGQLLTRTINHKARNGLTALHLAAQQVCLQAAEILLEYGADPNARDNNQETPMHKAGRRTAHVMYQTLKINHGDERLYNAFRQTPRDLLYDNVKF